MRYLHPFFRFYSVIVGAIARIYLPKVSRKTVLGLVGRYLFGMKREDFCEISNPLNTYVNINEFFTRSLDINKRPIHDQSIVSPCDGQIIDLGQITNSRILTRAKGDNYSLLKLTSDQDLSSMFSRGSFCNIYLSPRNYHRFHAPCSGSIEKIIYLNGSCYPVNSIGQMVKGLYSLNERYVVHIKNSEFNLCMIIIGAAAVRKIKINIKQGQKITKGDLLGMFQLGSSIIVLCDNDMLSTAEIIPGDVKVCGKLVSDTAPYSKTSISSFLSCSDIS